MLEVVSVGSLRASGRELRSKKPRSLKEFDMR